MNNISKFVLEYVLEHVRTLSYAEDVDCIIRARGGVGGVDKHRLYTFCSLTIKRISCLSGICFLRTRTRNAASWVGLDWVGLPERVLLSPGRVYYHLRSATDYQ